ncbi:farnesylcysteine lyase [Artemisia annua]|uniref:Farnesylcysteine lyase n=1 Tax=Artemisia annua TaxID=35608 RepID=A0A2U1KL02_ARTAN|nr:farnesylcysteine lyase [Artemisia annua]
MATVTIGGNTFEAGASILHPKNYHASNFTKMLGLGVEKGSERAMSLGIWDGGRFLFKTVDSASKSAVVQYLVSVVNSVRMLLRYGVSLLKMNTFVECGV